jgi:hypothetical protein
MTNAIRLALGLILALLAAAWPCHGDVWTWDQLAPIAQTIERTTQLGDEIHSGYAEEIHLHPARVDWAAFKQRAACEQISAAQCALGSLHRRFYAGADAEELAYRYDHFYRLSVRAEGALRASDSLTPQLRTLIARWLNERDWLQKQLGLTTPQ